MIASGLKGRDLPPCGTVDVRRVWSRIESAIQTLAPDIIKNLSNGANVSEIAAFESSVSHTLPNEVRESFLVHDGQCGKWSPDGSIFFNMEFCSLSRALGEWKNWAGLDCDEDLNSYARDNGISTPLGAIRLAYANPSWIPLVDIGGSNYFGIDLAPDSQGFYGQVINFGRDEERKYVLAWSWGWYLSDLADELERGNFYLSTDRNQFGLILRAPEPYNGSLFNLNREWSLAKTGGTRPFDPVEVDTLRAIHNNKDIMQLLNSVASNFCLEKLRDVADLLDSCGLSSCNLMPHFRNPGEHGTGCWAIDYLLGTRPVC